MKKYIYIEILKNAGFKVSSLPVRIECDDEGTPLDRFWRRRVIDSIDDNNCRVLKKKPKHFINKPNNDTLTR